MFILTFKKVTNYYAVFAVDDGSLFRWGDFLGETVVVFSFGVYS